MSRRPFHEIPSITTASTSLSRLIIGVGLALATVSTTAAGAAADIGPTPTERLATLYARTAVRLVEPGAISGDSADLARLYLGEAAALTPNDAELWRLAFRVGAVGGLPIVGRTQSSFR